MTTRHPPADEMSAGDKVANQDGARRPISPTARRRSLTELLRASLLSAEREAEG